MTVCNRPTQPTSQSTAGSKGRPGTSFKRSDEGEKISFQISGQVPLTAIRCGTLELNLGNNKKIHVIPIDSVKLDSSNKKTTIHLIFNSKMSNLELDPNFKDKNNDILENSTLTDSEEFSSEVLPISIVINSNNASK